MKNLIQIALFAFIFAGCTNKAITPIYKEVKTPIKCPLKVPLKPLNDGSFNAHKELMKYYLKCEEIAKFCTN